LNLVMFLAAIEVTIVGTAMPTIMARLGGVPYVAWVIAAYMLGATCTVPIYGRLADIYGRKRILFVGMTLFLLGSGLCGLAWNIGSLIAFRMLQGFGAGAVIPITTTIVGDLYPGEERPKALSLLSVVWGVSSVIGPYAGAYLTTEISWRAVFYVNIPFGILAMVVLWRTFHEERTPQSHQLGIWGSVLLFSGCSFLLLGLLHDPTQVQEGYWPFVRPAALGIGTILIAGFIAWEKRVAEPIMPRVLLQDRFVVIALIQGGLMGAVLYVLTTYIPLSVQGIRQSGPLLAGQVLLTISIGWTSSSLIAGRTIRRFGVRIHIWISAMSMCLGAYLLLQPQPDTPLLRIILAMVLIGVGMGTSALALLVAIQDRSGYQHRGIATSAITFFRHIGGALGVAVSGALFNGVVGSLRTSRPEETASLQAQGIEGWMEGIRTILDPEERGRLGEMADPVADAMAQAIVPVMWVGLGAAALYLTFMLFWPREMRSKT